MMLCTNRGDIDIMQVKTIIDILEEDILQLGRIVLEVLLKDRTTRKNIIWATDDYMHLGDNYDAKCEITIMQVTGVRAKVIQPRVTKAKENQSSRTRDKAEVFTPSWICNEQNNLIDEQWFGRRNVFNISSNNSWTATMGKIKFPNDNKKTWQDYVDARRLEISCGEAPYLVSRYDTVSGDAIELGMRIGLLDRKLRVVNENTNTEKDWFKWTIRAFQSIYGYEYQGDNLLLARENLLYTFIENMVYKFDRNPTFYELRTVARIISWNIWQMDGISYTVPFGKIEESYKQMTMFDVLDVEKRKTSVQQLCKITDWRSNVSMTYKSLLGDNGDG